MKLPIKIFTIYTLQDWYKVRCAYIYILLYKHNKYNIITSRIDMTIHFLVWSRTSLSLAPPNYNFRTVGNFDNFTRFFVIKKMLYAIYRRKNNSRLQFNYLHINIVMYRDEKC